MNIAVIWGSDTVFSLSCFSGAYRQRRYLVSLCWRILIL